MERKIYVALFWIVITMFLATTVSGCSGAKEMVNEPGSSSPQNKNKKVSSTMEFNQVFDLHSMKIRIINISMIKNNDPSDTDLKGKIALGVEIGNTTENSTEFDTESLELILNTGETTIPDLTYTSSLGGTYPPKRVQQGFITFFVKESELNSIKELKLKIPSLINEGNLSPAESEEILIPLEGLEF